MVAIPLAFEQPATAARLAFHGAARLLSPRRATRATIREAHLVMEMICDSGLMTSLDLVELNPFLDERGRTAQVMVELTASALGRRIFDRPTRAFA